MHRPHVVATRRFAVLVAAGAALLLPSPASAGRVFISGHDADHHCGRGGIPVAHKQCHFFQVATDYVRGGAPDPARPVLVLDRRGFDVVTSLDRIYGQDVLPRVVLDPRSVEFRTHPITTDAYSAVIIASSGGDPDDGSPQDLNDVGTAPDSEAINERADDLRAFFNAGGGLFVLSGNVHGDEPDDPYYQFLPITVRGARVQLPLALSDFGRSLGLVDEDVTCCPTHNTFEPPSESSALQAIDTDANGRIVSLVAEARRFSSLGEPHVTPQVVQEAAAPLPPANSCVRRQRLSLRIKRARGLRYSRASVFLNGRRVKRLRGRRVTRRFRLNVSRTTGDVVKVRIVVITTGKRKLTIRRSYRACQ